MFCVSFHAVESIVVYVDRRKAYFWTVQCAPQASDREQPITVFCK